MRINNILPDSKANGPGTRYTIWVQGCDIRCEGCSNKHMWDASGGYDMSINKIVEEVSDNLWLDGVTITGGEPLNQFDEVMTLCNRLRILTSVFVTTGYTMEQIVRKGYFGIMNVVDILCAGPYIKSKACYGQWRGSSNQTLYYLTELAAKQSLMPVISREIIIHANGDARETGFSEGKSCG